MDCQYNFSVQCLIFCFKILANSIPSFSISGEGAGDFSIDLDSGVITTRNILDRESQLPSYSLTVHARDQDVGFECTSSLRVILEDVNDNEPRFSEKVYKLTVKEDARIGSLIGSVLAYDSDLGMNRRIRYVLVSAVAEQETVVESQFAVDATTGMISLLRPLDRELISHYNLTVKVRPCFFLCVALYFMWICVQNRPSTVGCSPYQVALLSALRWRMLTITHRNSFRRTTPQPFQR